MIKFFKRLHGKKSYSCSEDLEMEEKDAEIVGSNQTSFLCRVDHQNSVRYAKDLKRRSEATSTVNLFESLNILSRGRLKLKEYKDEQEKECDLTPTSDLFVQEPGQKTIIWEDVFENNYPSKKLPEEHHYPEQLDSTQNSIPGKDDFETMESKCASLTHPEDGCDGKSENKQSKGDSKCVKSSDCTKRNENTSGRCTIHPQNSNGSSTGDGDEDEDESDENKRRRGKEEKFDDVQVIVKELEEEECEMMAVENSGIQVPLSGNQEVPAKDEMVPENQEVSPRDPQAPEAATADLEVPAADQEVPAADQEVPAADQEVPAADQEVPAADQEVPANHELSGRDQQTKKFEKGTRSFDAAFRCHGEKAGVIDKCKNHICYDTHQLLDHSRKCKFRVLGGCKKCEELRDIYIHHVSNCNDGKCVVTQCWSIKKYLEENNGKCPGRWSYHADKTFFGDRVTHDKPRDIPQYHGSQQSVTTEEIKELLLSLKNPLTRITWANQNSLPEKSIETRVPGMGESGFMYHPRRPPDNVEQSSIRGGQDKSPVSGRTLFDVAVTEGGLDKTESLPSSSSGIHSRGVSFHIETEEAEVREQEALSIVDIEKDEASFPRPDDIQLMHPLDEDKLKVKDGRYDEDHEWRIVHNQSFLGRGAFGVVRLCIDLSSNELFASKIIQKEKFESTELDIWASVSGHSVRCLELFGAVCVNNTVIMFMEYMEGGSVETMLSYLQKNRFNEYSALYIMREVLEGLDFLHCNRIIHRDVKGGNILVNHTLTKVKLADYGAAVKLDNHEFSRQENRPPGTENFMAPEVCRSEEHSFSSDIWSAGCSLYQMLEGQPPWIQYPSVIYKVGTTKEPPPFPRCSEPTTDLLNQIFKIVPQDRPTAKQLLRHCAFEEVNDPPEEPPRLIIPEEEDDEDQSQGDDNEQESSSENEFFSFEDDKEGGNEEEEEEWSLDENKQPAEHNPSLGVSDHTELSEHDSSGNETSDESPVKCALGGPELGGSGQHFGSPNQSSTPPIGGQSHVLSGLGQLFGSPNRLSSLASDCHSGTFPVDDELQSLQSEFLTISFLEGGDVSDFMGMSGSGPTVNSEQEDVFDISSLEEDNQEREPVYCPRRTYSFRDLTRVDLYDANGELLFTIREKTSCTFGHLAENLHSKIREKGQALQFFTFTFKEADDAFIDPNQELGFQDHEIVVLPAREDDQWTGWRIDDRGIVELQD